MKFASFKTLALFVGGAILLAGNLAVGTPTAQLLHVFSGGTNGMTPSSGGLVQARDGNFYGTTTADGAYNRGTIYRMTPSGVVTAIVQFNGTNNGINPYGGLMLSSDGYLYGTTYGNGAGNQMNQYGTVFRVSTNGNLTTLATFDYNNTGALPKATLIQASDGKLYGTTEIALTGNGTIFSCTTNGNLNAIYTFAIDPGSGTYVHGGQATGLTLGPGGNIYGTTVNGNDTNTFNNNGGTAFKITTGGNLTTLAYFDDPHNIANGASPYGALLLASDGNFYGTTSAGGGVGNNGTVFRLTPAGALSDIANFDGTNGAVSHAGLVEMDGSYYGTASSGGSYGYGTVFRVKTNGVFNRLVSFAQDNTKTNGSTIDGEYPEAPLVIGSDGSLYGTTTAEQGYTDGTAFRLNLPLITLQALGLSASGFSLRVNGVDTNGPVVLLGTTNFLNWFPILTNPPAAGPVQLNDSSATNSPLRFYRAREDD